MIPPGYFRFKKKMSDVRENSIKEVMRWQKDK